MKSKFICQNCGKEYQSNKANSKYCSMSCKRAFNNAVYNCDYCGKEMIVYKGRIDALKNGKHNSIYCSRECANKGAVNSREKECCFCHKPFMASKSLYETRKFCSKDCLNNFKAAKEKLRKVVCSMCGQEFSTYHKDQIYCSIECFGVSIRDRQKCVCDNCGVEFDRKKSDVENHDKHFCSVDCRVKYSQWGDEDVKILKDNYRKINTSKIMSMLSKSYSKKDINAEAIRLGITKSREWNEYETQILIENYPTKPMSEVLELLPERSPHSVIGKARALKLYSYFYTTRLYSPQEIQYLRDNYLTKSNEELACALNRDTYGVEQKLRNIGLCRPTEIKKDGYKNLTVFIRAKIYTWAQNIKMLNNYTCCVTGTRSNIIVHHCRSFNLLFQETIDTLKFDVKDNFSEYTDDELNLFTKTFLDLQEFYGEYVCINETIHKLFHKCYGYGDNTMEQWNEFVENYKNGYYKELA